MPKAHQLAPNSRKSPNQVVKRTYYENEAGFSPAPAVVALARALHVTTDELLGVKPAPRELSKLERLHSAPESRRLWKRFQQMAVLPEKDQRAVIRLINSLAGSKAQERASA